MERKEIKSTKIIRFVFIESLVENGMESMFNKNSFKHS